MDLMDFAKKQLEKYGWTDGKGLGKNEDGITTALKPKLKFDNAGIGHDVGEEFTNNWWERVYNNASSNVNVQVEGSKVSLKLNSCESVEINTKNYSVKELKKNKNLKYGAFIKTAKLTESGIEKYETHSTNNLVETTTKNITSNLTDDELFAACGGRTVHKGARHGLKLSGKLSRIEKQEKMLLKKMRNFSLSDKKDNLEKKIKKLKKQKEECINKATMSELDTELSSSNSSPGNKKKKKRKSVTFNNETVTKYYTPESNLNADNSTTKDENSNDTTPIVDTTAVNGFDEGIEQDIEDNNSEQDDNHKSFEEAQHNFNDLSKAERQKLKKKRKLEKKNGSTMKFLEVVMEDVCIDDDSKYNKCKKRKLILDDIECDSKQSQSSKQSKKQKYVTEKRKKKKEKRREKKLINSITQSLDNFCRISDDE